jgi:hypothetical protein
MATTCKIRGIYATALSALFKTEPGYEIIYPSPEMASRLNITRSFKPVDIEINDRADLLGVTIEGPLEAMTAENFPLTARVPGLAVTRGHPNKYAIYKGVVVKKNQERDYDHVMLDSESGITGILHHGRFKIGTEVVVQVEEPGSESGKRKPVLTRHVSYPGAYVVMIPEQRVAFSKNITDPGLKADLSDMLKTRQGGAGRWGIIFRSACNNATMEEISAELDALQEKADGLQDAIDRAGPGFIADPVPITMMNVIFSQESFEALDVLRREYVPTIQGHHYWRIVAKRLQRGDQAIEFAEFLLGHLQGGQDRVDRLFQDFALAEARILSKGTLLAFAHYKPDGDVYRLSPGKVVEIIDNDDGIQGNAPGRSTIVLRRDFGTRAAHGSYYDGFEGIEMRPGDYSICHAQPGFPVITNQYHRADGTFLGCYYNVSTPVLLFPGELQYTDLEIDVVEDGAGVQSVIDREKLDDAVGSGFIRAAMQQRALGIVDEILDGEIKQDLSHDDLLL